MSEKSASRPLDRRLMNLHDAKTIGILYDSAVPDNDIIITKFAEALRKQHKTVEILGYVNDPKIDHKADIEIFNPKSVNWYKVPQGEKIDKFIAKPYHLLIGAFMPGNLPLQYIASLSGASYRAGPYAADMPQCFDLAVNVAENQDLNYLLKQITHYLNEIRYDTK